jgi:hypothetical protein
LDLTKIEEIVGGLLGTLRGVDEQLKGQDSRWSANDDKLRAIGTTQDSQAQSLATLQHSVMSVGSLIRGLQGDVRSLRMALDDLSRQSRGKPADGFGSYDFGGGASVNGSGAARESGADNSSRLGATDAGDLAEREPAGVVRGQGEPSTGSTWPSLRVVGSILAVMTLIGASLYLAYGAFAKF